MFVHIVIYWLIMTSWFSMDFLFLQQILCQNCRTNRIPVDCFFFPIFDWWCAIRIYFILFYDLPTKLLFDIIQFIFIFTLVVSVFRSMIVGCYCLCNRHLSLNHIIPIHSSIYEIRYLRLQIFAINTLWFFFFILFCYISQFISADRFSKINLARYPWHGWKEAKLQRHTIQEQFFFIFFIEMILLHWIWY